MGKPIIEEKIKENETKGENLEIGCLKCKNKTKHMVLQSVDIFTSEVVPYEYGIDWQNHYQIVQCQSCESMSFRHLNWCSEFRDNVWDGATETLYPKISKNCLFEKSFLKIPQALRRIYGETVDSFNNKNRISSSS